MAADAKQALMEAMVGHGEEKESGDLGGSPTTHTPAPPTMHRTRWETICARYSAFVGSARRMALIGVQHVCSHVPVRDWQRSAAVITAKFVLVFSICHLLKPLSSRSFEGCC